MIRDNGYNYKSVRRWTKNVDVFTLDKVRKYSLLLFYCHCYYYCYVIVIVIYYFCYQFYPLFNSLIRFALSIKKKFSDFFSCEFK